MPMPKIPDFDYLRWEIEEPESDFWLLRDGNQLVGEVYQRSGGWYWHCKTSDWRGTMETFEAAKVACVASYVKEAMYKYAMERVSAVNEQTRT